MNEYIERETIIKKLNEIGGCDASNEWGKGWDMAIDTAIEAVEKLPSANVAPVKHGKWNVGYFHDRVCSVCTHPDSDLNVFPHKYCPNCGAKMDDEERGNQK